MQAHTYIDAASGNVILQGLYSCCLSVFVVLYALLFPPLACLSTQLIIDTEFEDSPEGMISSFITRFGDK